MIGRLAATGEPVKTFLEIEGRGFAATLSGHGQLDIYGTAPLVSSSKPVSMPFSLVGIPSVIQFGGGAPFR